jgi:hypothetical protein
LRAFVAAGLTSLAPVPDVELTDLSAAASGAPPTVTLFLYEIEEDACSRNPAPTTRRTGGVVTSLRAPATLKLRYLLTVWADDHVSAHTILGRIIQLFHDDAIVRSTQLTGSLATEAHALKVRLVPLALEDRARVWHAVQQRYRLSVIYEVRVVRVESLQTTDRTAVESRELKFVEGGRP